LETEKLKGENLALMTMQKFKPDAPQYTQAKNLYTKAHDAYNTYCQALLIELRTGTRQDLTPTATQAAQAAKAFADWVNTNVPNSKSPALIPIIVDAVIQVAEAIWDFFSNKDQAKRDAAAEALQKQIFWTSWTDLAAGA
jgi:hypothetical protein